MVPRSRHKTVLYRVSFALADGMHIYIWGNSPPARKKLTYTGIYISAALIDWPIRTPL